TYRNKSGGAPRVRCNVFVHIADSAAKGVDELIPGWSAQRRDLYRNILGMPIPDSPDAHRRTLASLVESGAFIVGDTATSTRMIGALGGRLGDRLSLNFFVPRWLPHETTLDQLSAIARDVVPALFGASSGTAESMRLTADEASRQMKRRAAIR